MFNGTSNDSAGLDFTSNYVNYYGYTGHRFYAQAANIGSMAERMRITVDGKVGIGTGTNNPSDELTIRGAQFATTQISIGDSGDRLRLGYVHSDALVSGTTAGQIVTTAGTELKIAAGSNAASNIQFFTSASSGAPVRRMTIDSSGKVGIGTTSPEGTLQVENASNNALILNAPANRYNSVGFQTAGTDKWWLGRADSDQIASDAFFIGVDNGNATDAGGLSAKLVIDTSGNVGIGVTSIPSWANLMTSGTVAVGGTLYMKTGNTIQALSDFPGGASDLTMQTGGGKVTIGGSGGGNRGHLELFGRYGSGDPKLSFKSDHPTSGNTTTWDMARISASDGGNYNGVLSFQVAAGSGSEGSGAGLATAMTIQDTKNVGIGTENPTMPLSVQAASNAYAISMHGRSDGYSELYGASNDGSTKYSFLQSHSAQTKLYTLVNTPLLFGTNSTERMRIRSDGGMQYPTNNTFIATANGTTAYEWGAIRRPASAGDGGQLTVRQFSSGDTAANYPAYASSNGSGTWDENTGVYFPALDQVGLTANGNPTLTIEAGKKIELYENGFTSGDANRGQRVCLGGISHIASTNPGGTGSGVYLHVKTNLPKSNIMFRFEYKGLSYSGSNMDTSIIGYTYTGQSSVHSVGIETMGSTTYNFKTPYYSSDNKLVLVLQIANNYTGGMLWAQFVGSHAMAPGTIAIASCIYSGNTSGAF